MKTTHPLFVAALLIFGPMFAPLMPRWSVAADEADSVSPRDAEVKAPVAPDDDAAPQSPAEAEDKSPISEPVRVVYPDDRPEWVEAAATSQLTKAQGRIDRIAVSSGPHFSQGEARRQLEEAIDQAAADYLNRHLGSNHAARFVTYAVAPVETYEERPEFSVGPMYQAHALLEFNESFRRQAENDWKEALTLSRLLKTGLGGAAMLVLLAVVLGYFKADTATRGYYTRRLRFGAATVILALAAAIFFAVRWIPWMI
jgi:hypothetical protein